MLRNNSIIIMVCRGSLEELGICLFIEFIVISIGI